MLSYQDAQKRYERVRDPNRGTPVQRNTRLIRRDGYFAIQLHGTDVVEIYPNGTYGIRHGGWTTNTTRDRIYGFSPLCWDQLQSEAGDWYLRVRGTAADPEPPSRNYIRVVRPYPEPPEPIHGPERQYEWHLRSSRQSWETWHAQMKLYGSMDAWRSAWREDRQRVIDANRLWRAWNQRNRIPFDRLVRINGEGYPLWSEVRSVRSAEAARRRAETRNRRALEAAERERRAIERFKASVRRRRKPTFEQRAAEVAVELAAIAEGLKVSVSINDSQEIRA
jgi:hypothetical protein